MSPALIGMFVGLLLANVALQSGGFVSLIIAMVFGIVGYVVGGQMAGQFDVREMTLRDLTKQGSRHE